MDSKIVTKEEFKTKIRPQIKNGRDGSNNKTIALCHGVFDLVHPGHIIHLKQAKEMADILVVSVTSAKYVRKGPGRPFFDDRTRLEFLSELECVDYCILSEGYTVDDVIESVEPDYYVKGEEYSREDEDITGMIRKERELVEAHGGSIRYTTGQTYSSTKLINTALSGLSDDVINYMTDLKTGHSMDDLLGYFNKAAELKVLLIGDVIVDKYTYCRVQGLISKEASYSARLISSEDYLGGVLAIARHLMSFSDNVTVMSAVGTGDGYYDRINDELGSKLNLLIHTTAKYPTIVKERFLTKNEKREEYRKIFTINNIPDKVRIDEDTLGDIKRELNEIIDKYDVVFICDFGHGLIDEEIIEIISEKAKKIALNCQTNSSNKGLNLITKYDRADYFALDQAELKLAYPRYADDENTALEKLSEQLGGQGWLTRGSQGAYGITSNLDDHRTYSCPALTLNVKDTVGAGDAFYSVAGILAAAGAPTELSLFAGNVGGALASNIVGNKESLEKVNVLKFASTLFNV